MAHAIKSYYPQQLMVMIVFICSTSVVYYKRHALSWHMPSAEWKIMKINPAGARVINNPAALRAGSSTQINSIFRPANKIRGPVCGRNNALLYHRSGGERYGGAITSRWIHRMAGNYCKCGRARLELPRGNQIAQRAHTKRRAVHLTHWW